MAVVEPGLEGLNHPPRSRFQMYEPWRDVGVHDAVFHREKSVEETAFLQIDWRTDSWVSANDPSLCAGNALPAYDNRTAASHSSLKENSHSNRDAVLTVVQPRTVSRYLLREYVVQELRLTHNDWMSTMSRGQCSVNVDILS